MDSSLSPGELERVAETLRGLLERIERGELDASPAIVGSLAGSLAAVEELLAGSPDFLH